MKDAIEYIKTMFSGRFSDNLELSAVVNGKLYIVLLIAIVSCGPVQEICKKYFKSKNEKNYGQPILIGTLMILCIMTLVSNTYNPFIYFRF